MTLNNLHRRIDRMLAQERSSRHATTWFLLMEVGQEIPAHILSQIGISDSFIIEEIPANFLGDDTDLPKIAWCKRGDRYFVPGKQARSLS